VVEKKWSFAVVDRAVRDRLATELNVSPILAGLLLNRGVSTADEAARFLSPRLADLHDPFLLPDMEPAVERIVRAVRNGEPIAICGDYDVDGLSSTALFVEFFRRVGTEVQTYIPNRIEDGYGLNATAVNRLANASIRLIITVDNGSSAGEEIELASARGVDVVVSDHHPPSDPLPRPLALVNPHHPASRYPFPHLAGVGVAYKLIWAISQNFSRSRKLSPEFREFMLEGLALVALGTISDVVPLHGENRVLAKFGLAALAESRRPGIRRLVERALRGEEEALRAEHVAFRIGPAINAVGRLGQAESGLRLLTTGSSVEADTLIADLESANRRRQEIERGITATVRDRVLAEVDLSRARAIVLADAGWHPGVVGIAAARAVDEFHRPTILIALNGKTGRGSARSIPGVNICEALGRCRQHLIGYGGHAYAAGVEIAADSVEGLRHSLQEAILSAPAEMLKVLDIEAEVSLNDLNQPLLSELERLEPHGAGNRAPLLATRELKVAGEPRPMGQDGRHLTFYVRGLAPSAGEGSTGHPASRPAYRAVAFGRGESYRRLLATGRPIDLAFRPRLNRWGGNERIELNVEEVRFCSPAPDSDSRSN